MALHREDRLVEAEAAYLAILGERPDEPEPLQLVGLLYQQCGQTDRAIQFLQRANELMPNSHTILHNLAVSLGEGGQLEAAVEHFERVLRLQPDYALAWKNSGVILQRLGRIEEAAQHFERAVALDPDVPGAHSSLLFLLNHLSGREPQAVFEEHRRWAAHVEATVPAHPPTFDHDPGHDRDPDRRLRIGYLSPDLQTHSVGFFIEPLIEAHGRGAIEVTCYASVEQPDAVTARIRANADRWRDIWGVPDERVAELIREDGIDILVDLAGHTKRNRLRVMALRPAPVQVTYLGYPNTTGLEVVDFRITDTWADPPGTTEHLHTEELVRLPGGFLSYRPPDGAPEPVLEPSRNRGEVTFGSFNKALKVSPETLDTWAQILERVPGSRLLLKSDTFSHESGRAAFTKRLEALGIDADRVELLPARLTLEEHLTLYERIDIGLDPFPYNGTTTTCEAMWMGVPVVTLAGEVHAGRVGVSLLTAVGLEDLIAATVDDYVEIAAGLAADRARIGALRHELRDRMRRSPLCDATSTATELEHAYRALWRRWCASHSSISEKSDLSDRRTNPSHVAA